jgi:hypothetical protein
VAVQCVEMVHGGHRDTYLWQAAAQRREPVGCSRATALLEQLLVELVEQLTDRLEVRRGRRCLFWMRLPSGEQSALHDLAGVDLAPHAADRQLSVRPHLHGAAACLGQHLPFAE